MTLQEPTPPSDVQEHDNQLLVLLICADGERVLTLTDHLSNELPSHELLTAPSGESGLDMLGDQVEANRPVGLIFFDHALPDIKGDALAEQLFNRWPNAQRVILAPDDAELDLQLLQQGTVQRVMRYPFRQPEISLGLQDLARNYALSDELADKKHRLTELQRASLSLTGEVRIENLLEKVLRIVIDNSKAEYAYIILKGDDENYFIEASINQRFKTEVQQLVVNDFSPVCPAVVDFCTKNLENLILADAINEGFFASHPYIRKNLCRSILCLPLVYQGNVLGALYLDNKSMPNAFRTDSLRFFEMLSGPAAVAISNARLYGELEARVEERTLEVKAQKEQIERQRDEIAVKNDDIVASIRYASRIQQAVLPDLTDIQAAFPNSFVYHRPKDVVSGDFYWFTQKLSKTIIAAADCTGHGIPGAFVTIMANTLLKQIVELEGIFTPSEILLQLHLRIRVALKQNVENAETAMDGLDIALAQIDTKRGKLQFAGANRPLLIIRNGEVIEIKADRYGCGGQVFEEEHTFTNHQVQLEDGDSVYLFSDGFQDQIGDESNRKFKSRHFQEFLTSIAQRDMPHQRLLLDAELRHWKGEAEQTDDILVIGVGYQAA